MSQVKPIKPVKPSRLRRVTGNALGEAEALIEASYLVAGVMTLRVALERAVRQRLIEAGRMTDLLLKDRLGVLAKTLKRRRKISEASEVRLCKLYGELSPVAHGESVTESEAVDLLKRTRREIEKLFV